MKRILLTCALTLLATAASAAVESWPHYRPAPAPGVALPETFGLTLEWKKPIDVGYSSVVIADGKALTMFRSGEDDVLAAFALASGEELWRYRLAETYPAHDGGDGGPVSTPTIDGDRVYALGPRGQLVAVALADGRELWKAQLDESRSTVPFYGYTTVPLVAGDQVLVLTGGEGHGLTAFDRKSGAQRWTRYDDGAAYQSPVLARLAGREQVVVVGNQWARGLDPESGDELWSFRHTEGEDRNESAHPTPAGDDRVLLDLDGESLMLHIAAQDGGLAAHELWRGRAFAGTLPLPVYHDGALYGFTGSVLVAADAATGDLLWRSREVAGRTLSLVGDSLVVVANDGQVVVARASKTGYEERARLATFAEGTLSSPAYAGGRILVRNLHEIASLKVDAGARPTVAAAEPAAEPKGDFGRFVAGLAAVPAAERQAKLDAYLAGKSLPLVEEKGLAHVVYRGKADDVGLVGSAAGPNQDVGLAAIAGTDAFYASLELDPEGHYEYAFVVDFGQPAPDPANPHTVEDFGVTSELAMPGWRVNPALAEPPAGTPRGEIQRFELKSEALGNSREIQVWLPPGYAAGDARYPLVVFNYGDRELKAAKMANVLDNLTAQGAISPPVAVFVPRAAGAEYVGPQVDGLVTFLTNELVPHLEKQYRLQAGADSRAILGVGSAGFAAVYAAFAAPGSFGKVAANTFYVPDGIAEAATAKITASTAKPSLLWLERSPFDYSAPPNDSLEDAPWLAETARAKGAVVREVEHKGQPEWGAWRSRRDLILAAFFPPPSS